MAKKRTSVRHIQIDKSNSAIIATIAIASACFVFALVATQSLWSQASYNKKVITAKEKTVNQLSANIASLDSLKTSYQAFVSEPTNVIGGSSTGTGDRDGDNAKITLDAMPSIYDFPGTISGLNKVLSSRSFTDVKITGTDDEVNQTNNTTPTVANVPLNVSAKGSTEAAQEFLKILDLSIRPMRAKTVNFSGQDSGSLDITVNLDTYYQPKKKFEVKTEVVK